MNFLNACLTSVGGLRKVNVIMAPQGLGAVIIANAPRMSDLREQSRMMPRLLLFFTAKWSESGGKVTIAEFPNIVIT